MRSNISGAYFYIKEAKYEIKMRIAQHINCTILIMYYLRFTGIQARPESLSISSGSRVAPLSAERAKAA